MLLLLPATERWSQVPHSWFRVRLINYYFVLSDRSKLINRGAPSSTLSKVTFW